MSFLVAAALAVGALVLLPAIAHLLRRGRAAVRPFPPASLVKSARSVARRERRLEDRLLFALRAVAILMLAVLGATPLVRCSRLSLARGSGGSVAVVMVLDDSLSMRAVVEGRSRWDRAMEAARQLLDSVREGDSVAIVLAGQPARIALGATMDLAAARRTLERLEVSDRSTDLAAAVSLARSTAGEAMPKDKRVVVLSDFAAAALPADPTLLWAPLPELSRPVPDCAVARAARQHDRIVATVACNDAAAARGRSLELVPLEGSGVEPETGRRTSGAALAQITLEARAGVQTVSLRLDARAGAVRLTGTDGLAHDDVASIALDDPTLSIGLLADAAGSSGDTGGPPLVQQAITALEQDTTVRPLAVLPDQPAELAPHGLLILDDPVGLSPEARAALMTWVEAGGLAVALIGPRGEATKLGAPLEPFVVGSMRWEREPSARGASVESLGWLGPEALSLADLSPKGRATFNVAAVPGARMLATFTDGRPFLVERELGRGIVTTVALPSSIEQSDFALRPGFLALLEYLLDAARKRRGLAQSVVGATWSFGGERPDVVGPEGPLEVRDSAADGRIAVPAVRGAYRVRLGQKTELRSVALEPEEITATPSRPDTLNAAPAGAASAGKVDVSNEASFALVGLLALELAARMLRRMRA